MSTNKKQVMYLKVTEACNMKCPFCYVPQQPIFMTQDVAYKAIEMYNPDYIIFHGGEPLLNPDLILDVIKKYSDKEYSMTSNMVIPIGEKQLKIIHTLGNGNTATSYSIDRFYNQKDFEIFKQQVKLLKDYTLIVTISIEQLNQSPKALANIIKELNPKYIDIERVSFLGNEFNPDIYKLIDLYISELFTLIPKEKNVLYLRMKDAITYDTYVYNTECSKDLITINADGSTLSCPNTCSGDNTEPINLECFTCDIFQYCGGDCETFKGVCKFPKNTFLKVKNGDL